MPGDEVVVPQVVGIEEADERRVELGQAAPDRAALTDVRLELEVAKAAVVELRQAGPDRLVGPVVEASSTMTARMFRTLCRATDSMAFPTKSLLL
jgi:hypothetical protein